MFQWLIGLGLSILAALGAAIWRVSGLVHELQDLNRMVAEMRDELKSMEKSRDDAAKEWRSEIDDLGKEVARVSTEVEKLKARLLPPTGQHRKAGKS